MKRFRRTVHLLRREPAGRRFQNMVNQPGGLGDQGPVERTVKLLLGLLLLLAGVFMLAVPGPGLLAILFGLGILASAFPPVARFLDRGEVLTRSALQSAAHRWTEASVGWKVAVVVLLVFLLGATVWGVWIGFGLGL